MKKKILSYLFSIAAAAITNAQQVNAVFFNWNNSNSNYPGYMMAENFSQEDNGILWLGGREGLWRFDGHHFQPFVYSVNDSNSIPGNYIAAQFIEGNTLYGGCFGAGFFTLDLNTLKVKRIDLLGPAMKSKLSVSSIAPKGKDSLWLAVTGKQLICINRKNFEKRKNFSLSPLPGQPVNNEMILDIISSKAIKNKLWLLCNKSLLLADELTGQYQSFTFTVNNSNGQTIQLAKPTGIIEESDSTALLSFFEHGLIKWNFVTNKWKHFTYKVNAPRLQTNSINGLIEKSKGQYFVAGSDSGLYIFHSQTEKFTKEYNPYRATPAVFSNPARQLFKDKNGGIFISMIGGISYWHPQYQGVDAFSMPAIVAPTVASSVQNFDTHLLITRRDKKKPLIIFKKQKQQWVIPQQHNLANDYIRLKTEQQDQFLYKSVSGKWFSYDHRLQQLKPWLPRMKAIDLQNLQSSNENERFSVYCLADSLIVFDKKLSAFSYHTYSDRPDSLHSKRCFSALFDQHNTLWIATSTGLSLYDLSSKKFREISFRKDKMLEGLEIVTDMQLLKNGHLYVATQQKGIFVFDTKTRSILAQYNKENLLAENFVYNIIIDTAAQKLVAATLGGITVINLKLKTAHRWDKFNSGLQIEDGFFGISLSGNDELYAADSVLYRLNIAAISKINIAPFVSGFIAGKKYYSGSAQIKLDKQTSYVELFISTGFFADNAHAQLQYCLDKDQEWNIVENGKIIIPGLKNGKTTLQLRAVLQGIVAGEGQTTVMIERGLYYYQAAWFKLTIAALLLGMVWLIFKSRINRVRKQEREKALLQHKIDQLETASLRSQMNPHFIFNTLSSLRYLVLMGDHKKASGYILKLSKLLRMIITHSRQPEILIQDELDFLQLYLEIESLRFDNGFSYAINTDDAADIFDLHIPPMLLQPFVENAIKHGLVNSQANEKWIKIKVHKINDNSYLFSITDNGIGRTKAATLHKQSDHQSLGTTITNERIALFNKTSAAKIHYSIEDYNTLSENTGTVVKIFYEPAL